MSTTTAPIQTHLPGQHTPGAPAIASHGLTKRYGQLVAVDSLDLTIPRGQLVALLGPNGAGKSTTTEMILGLTSPDAGTVQVLDTSAQDATRRGLVGAMLQDGALLEGVPVRVLLNMLAAIQPHPMPMSDVIELADVGDILATNTNKLSGGQKQRVRMAGALLPNPELLILDEPTAGMDVETRRRFWTQMGELAAQGRTIIFATHYLEEADEFAERVVVLSHGRLVAEGTGAEIKQQIGARRIHLRTATPQRWADLPGVSSAIVVGDRVELQTTNSDATLRALILADWPVRDIEVSAARLEDAFIKLTSQPAEVH